LPSANSFGDLRRSTLSWCRRTRISASNVARDRNSPIKAYQINLQRSLIGSEYQPIRGRGQPKGSIRLSLSSIRPSIGTENPIPEEMNHREIAVRVPVMNEVQFLFPSEPCKPVKSRSLYVVFLVEKDMRVERRRVCDCLNHEEIEWQYEVCTRSHQKHRNEEEGCIVAFVTEVRPRNEMIFGIVGVMEVDVVLEEPTAHWMVAELVMHQRLRK
jgi:hypothetical protein